MKQYRVQKQINRKKETLATLSARDYTSVVKNKTKPQTSARYSFLFYFILSFSCLSEWQTFKILTSLLSRIWVHGYFYSLFVVNWCKNSEGQFCVYIKTFKCMKFTLRYICKFFQDMPTYIHADIAVFFAVGKKSRKYINEKLVELVWHIYKVEWDRFVCADREISARYIIQWEKQGTEQWIEYDSFSTNPRIINNNVNNVYQGGDGLLDSRWRKNFSFSTYLQYLDIPMFYLNFLLLFV